MKIGDLVKYCGNDWPDKGTLGIIIGCNDANEYSQAYPVVVYWCGFGGSGFAYEKEETLELVNENW